MLPTPLSAGFITCHQVNITALGWGLSSIPRAQFPSLPHGHFTGLFSLDTMPVSDSAVSRALFSRLLPKPENLLHFYTKTEDRTSRESDGDLSSMFCGELQTSDGCN